MIESILRKKDFSSCKQETKKLAIEFFKKSEENNITLILDISHTIMCENEICFIYKGLKTGEVYFGIAFYPISEKQVNKRDIECFSGVDDNKFFYFNSNDDGINKAFEILIKNKKNENNQT